KMSDELREQLRWLLDSQQAELVAGIAEGRRLDHQAAQRLVDSSPYSDDAALKSGVVDAVLSEEHLPAHLGRDVRIDDWDHARRKLPGQAPSLGRGAYVAIIRIEGTIIDGRSGRPPVPLPLPVPVVGDARAGDLTIVQVARQVARDRRAAAAVLYVNSRGGSATASEAMRAALELVGSRKPLVVAMGPVAGSGGYLVAAPGRWIVARPGTLTGSRRVWAGRQRVGRRLVDEMGALEASIAKARGLAGLPEAAPAREVHPPKRSVAPRTLPTAAALAGYLAGGVSLFNRTPALMVM